MSAILATGMLVAGIALGVLIGPGPASSLANGTRAAAIARALALLALGDGTGSQLLLSTPAAHTSASAATQTGGGSGNTTAAGGANATASGHGSAPGMQSETGSSTSSPSTSPPANGPSPTKQGAGPSPSPGAGEAKPARLPPIAQVWLIVLPYGQSFANTLAEPSAAPYLTGQLLGRATLLNGYSSLTASALANDAALAPGQETAGVNLIAPPCTALQSAAGSAPSTGASASAPCAASEVAGAQAVDSFLREVVPQITATASYREHGLIVITFAAMSAGTSTSTAGSSSGSPPLPAIAYPAGTLTSASTAAETSGALLLSPFLRHPGARLSSAFDSLTPRKSLEELLTNPSTTVHP